MVQDLLTDLKTITLNVRFQRVSYKVILQENKHQQKKNEKNMLKHYKKPTSEILESNIEILDVMNNIGGYCNETCRIWHICPYRHERPLIYCEDKRL